MHNCNFCTLNFCPISVVVVISFHWHPSAFWTASSPSSFIQRSCNILPGWEQQMGAICPAQAAWAAWGRCSPVPRPGLVPAGRTSEQGTLRSFFTSIRAATCRTGYCPLVSHVFSILCLGFLLLLYVVVLPFFFFFRIHCSNNQCSKDFLHACCRSAEVISRYAFEQSLLVLLQLQATDCEISFVLRLVPLNVKSKHHLILCRATAVFSKDSKRWYGVLHCSPYEKAVIFFLSFLQCFVLEHALKVIYHKKREKKA